MLSRAAIIASLAVVFCTVPAGAAEPEPAPMGHAAEGGGHGHEHEQINWTHGFIGEKEGVEPSLLWRPKGMPPPLLANVFNTAVLVFLIYWFGRKPMREALRKRKSRIASGINEAGKMKEDAAGQLAEYERKLKHADEEIERVRRDMRQSAETERHRILEEAKARRERMERDARLLIEQELKAAREQLFRETVQSAVRSAEELLSQRLTPADHEQLETQYIDLVKKAVNSMGGRA